MKDREFLHSNQVLSGLVKHLKREGKDKSCHKEPICEEDLHRLYSSGLFSLQSPNTLQNKVLFDIISQFGRRGQEGLRNLTKHSFISKADAKGRKYVTMTYNESDKTHHGIDCKEEIKEPRMYENEGEFCPVKSYEKYLSKLNPSCEVFFQRPLEKVTSTLHEQGFSSRAIMSVTGHRNVASLASYIKPSEDERERLSRALCPSPSSNTVPAMSITPPTLNPIVDSTPTNFDVNLQHEKSLDIHMFTGNISNSSITVNIYQKQ